MRAERQHEQGAGLEMPAGSPDNKFLNAMLNTIQEGAAIGQFSEQSLKLLSSEVNKIVKNPTEVGMPATAQPIPNPHTPSRIFINNLSVLNHNYINEPPPKVRSRHSRSEKRVVESEDADNAGVDPIAVVLVACAVHGLLRLTVL
ncbi:hypothetical protein BJ165DRAFT_1398395 [Panaeolus papilionaceus]|nr:hypothetical protein BJ165DRAFT_1398395 [Panaeolus papilionaceus]